MDSLQATYNDEDDEDNELTATTADGGVTVALATTATTTTTSIECNATVALTTPTTVDCDDTIALTTTTTDGGDTVALTTTAAAPTPDTESETLISVKEEPLASEELSDDKAPTSSPKFPKISEDDDEEDEGDPERPPKKHKPLSLLTSPAPLELESVAPTPPTHTPATTTASKKSKKKTGNNVWTKPTSRKGKKKSKNNNNGGNNNTQPEDNVLITPIPRFPDKNDDSVDMKICLSKVYKAEKVELSEDRLSAGSCKGYRMVRTTRGVSEGAWYYEIKIVKLGETGHTRLGWSTEKGDLQAPVGYDGNSFGYRDVDGSKVHKALRENYGEEGYVEGDVIGFYIILPEGSLYMPKPVQLVWYKGQRYVCAPDAKEDPPKVVPGSEISFFKNGKCQGLAFKDLYGGRYYPAASMYTLPNQPNCVVRFNFGPDFESFPEDFGGRLVPRPMIEVPYHGFDGRVENGVSKEKKH
ncbi:hypothetical protein RJ640_027682 [Escallonia rubra]|uniref:B30.2/SPRY domain-containing protein n=1 Tax=Escallonia rubra TaxID=112253 RepID=A0AA88RXT1_9ASTE|nr:hypothetical protein RJ640_027682 [Escallonia rubra]